MSLMEYVKRRKLRVNAGKIEVMWCSMRMNLCENYCWKKLATSEGYKVPSNKGDLSIGTVRKKSNKQR